MALFSRKKKNTEEFAFPKGFDPVLYTVENPNASGINLFSSTASDPLSVSIVYASVGVRADIMSTLPIHFFQTVKGKSVRLYNHPLAELFNINGNRYQSPVEMREYIQMSYDLNGNGYAQIIRNGRGDVIELLPLYPDTTTPFVDENNELRYGYGDTVFEDFDVFHLKGMGGILEGKSPITLLANQLNIIKAGENHQKTFYSNGATPNFVIESDGPLKGETRESLENKLNTGYSGANANKTLILTNGLHAKPLSLSFNDAQIIQSLNMSAERIAAVYRVPAHLLNLPNIRPSYASSQANSLDFYKFTIRGLATRWEAVINKKLLSQKDKNNGVYAKFNMDAILRADLSERYASYQLGVQAGVISPNEARSWENLEPVEGGESPWVPLNMMRLSDKTNNNNEV